MVTIMKFVKDRKGQSTFWGDFGEKYSEIAVSFKTSTNLPKTK